MLVEDWISRNVGTVTEDVSMIKAGRIMREKKIRRLPVVDAAGTVVGIITNTDIFRLFVSITGIDQDGIQIGLRLPTKPVLDALRGHEARIISILSSYDRVQPGQREVSIRIQGLPETRERELRAALEAHHQVLYWTRD